MKSAYMGVPTIANHIDNFEVDKTGMLVEEDVATMRFRDVVASLSANEKNIS